MKKFLLSAIAVSMVASPILAAAPADAQPRHQTVVEHKANGRTVVTKRTTYQQPARYRTWHRGERFNSRYARNYRVVSNYRDYRLKAPPRGYHWVRSGNDAVLVAITSGLIGVVVGNAIR